MYLAGSTFSSMDPGGDAPRRPSAEFKWGGDMSARAVRWVGLAFAGTAWLGIAPFAWADPPLKVQVTNTVPVSGTVSVSALPPVTLAGPVAVKSPDASALYNIPFFIEQTAASSPPVPTVADFTLAGPAILESLSMNCGGLAVGVMVEVDAGPLGIHGASGVPGSANTSVLVGLGGIISTTNIWLNAATKANGDSYLPVSPVGLPVNANFRFRLYPDLAGSGASCFVNVVLRNLG